jgi:MoaA/NifB/PqqE/SkfB family radical SAM enzyme
MELLSTARSQLNNLRNFRQLFDPVVMAKSAMTLPRDLLSPAAHAAPPAVLNFLTAARCNLKCVMCSADKLMGKTPEMTPADYDHVARQALPFRPSCFMGGGEPFLRSDILECVHAIKKHGLRLGMVTNGLGVTPERGKRLKEMGLDTLMFSIHGTEEAHDRVTAAPGSYRRATEHVRAFCKGPRRTRVMLNFVLQPENLDSVFELAEVGRSLGVDQVRVEHLLFATPREVSRHDARVAQLAPEAIRGSLALSTHFRDSALPEGHAERLSGLLRGLKAKYGDFVFIKPHLDEDEVAAWYAEDYDEQKMCLFIWRSLFIMPEGHVVPCQSYSEMRFGNVLREPLLEIWNSQRYRKFRALIRKERLPGCARCCKH